MFYSAKNNCFEQVLISGHFLRDITCILAQFTVQCMAQKKMVVKTTLESETQHPVSPCRPLRRSGGLETSKNRVGYSMGITCLFGN